MISFGKIYQMTETFGYSMFHAFHRPLQGRIWPLVSFVDILYDSWSPAMTVSSICISILSMLSSSTEKVHATLILVHRSFYIVNALFVLYKIWTFFLSLGCSNDRPIMTDMCRIVRTEDLQRRRDGGSTMIKYKPSIHQNHKCIIIQNNHEVCLLSNFNLIIGFKASLKPYQNPWWCRKFKQ